MPGDEPRLRDKALEGRAQGSVSVFEWLSFGYHATSMERGVIDTRDVLFFLTVIGLSLGLAFRSLESRRWK